MCAWHVHVPGGAARAPIRPTPCAQVRRPTDEQHQILQQLCLGGGLQHAESQVGARTPERGTDFIQSGEQEERTVLRGRGDRPALPLPPLAVRGLDLVETRGL